MFQLMPTIVVQIFKIPFGMFTIRETQLAYLFIATLEDAVMLSKLERINDAISTCITFLRTVNDGIIVK